MKQENTISEEYKIQFSLVSDWQLLAARASDKTKTLPHPRYSENAMEI